MDVNIGKGITLEVDSDALPPNVLEHVIRIGLRNILMDSHASITEESNPRDRVEVSRAMSLKKLEAMLNGDLRVAGTRESDPVRAEAMRLVLDVMKTAWRKSGRKIGDLNIGDAKAKATTLIAEQPKWLVMAQKRIDEARAEVGDLADELLAIAKGLTGRDPYLPKL